MSVQVWAVGSPWSRCKQVVSTVWPAHTSQIIINADASGSYHKHRLRWHIVPVTPGGRGIWTLTGCRKCMSGVWERQRRGLTLAWGSPHNACTSDAQTCSTYSNGRKHKALKTTDDKTDRLMWIFTCGTHSGMQRSGHPWSRFLSMWREVED